MINQLLNELINRRATATPEEAKRIDDGLALLGALATASTFSRADVSTAADLVRRTRSSVLVVAKLRRV